MKAERKEDGAHERRQNRLHKGTYGYCLRCGRPIPAGRLAAMPEAELCVPCQEEEETRPASRRPVEEQRL